MYYLIINDIGIIIGYLIKINVISIHGLPVFNVIDMIIHILIQLSVNVNHWQTVEVEVLYVCFFFLV